MLSELTGSCAPASPRGVSYCLYSSLCTQTTVDHILSQYCRISSLMTPPWLVLLPTMMNLDTTGKVMEPVSSVYYLTSVRLKSWSLISERVSVTTCLSPLMAQRQRESFTSHSLGPPSTNPYHEISTPASTPATLLPSAIEKVQGQSGSHDSHLKISHRESAHFFHPCLLQQHSHTLTFFYLRHQNSQEG